MWKVDILISRTASKGCVAKLLLIPNAVNVAVELSSSNSLSLQNDSLKMSGIFWVVLPVQYKAEGVVVKC